ncbi:MAG: hypothetical protein ACFE9Z_01180 [Promethearchaeota archaeon]
MKFQYKCSECGNSFPEDLIDYLKEGNQVFCERCGAPFCIKITKFEQKPDTKENKNNYIKWTISPFIFLIISLIFYISSFSFQFTFFGIISIIIVSIILVFTGLRNNKLVQLISPENRIKGKKILIGIIILNFILIIYFFYFLTIIFNPYTIITLSHSLFILKFLGVFIFVFILIIGILEIGRGLKLLRIKGYESQVLMLNTVGQDLLREVLYPPSREEEIKLKEKKISALKILIPFMYLNFFLANFYYSLPYNHLEFILEVELLLLIYIIVYIFHLFLGLIILFKAEKLGYQFLKRSSIMQLILFNIIIVLFIGNPYSNIIVFILLDINLIYLTIRIIKNKEELNYYLTSKNRVFHSSKVEKGIDLYSSVQDDFSKRKFDSEKFPATKDEKRISSYKGILDKEEVITKKFEAEENTERFSEDLLFINDEKDRKIVEKYLLERFVVVSEQVRKFFNELNLTKEEKIEILKEFSFLPSRDQKILLELL